MKEKILNVIYVLVGLIFINAGLNKFLNYMPVPEDLPEALVSMSMAMMEIGWLMPLVAIAEITG
ncbi:MAG: DoxX family protein, partial [Balneolaceae bacterium]